MSDGQATTGARSGSGSTVAKVVLAGAVVVALVIGRWLTTSFEDWVPLVAPDELPAEVAEDDLPVSARFECSAPLGADPAATASAQARDALEIQTLSRTPCDDARTQHRVLGALDLVVILIVLIATLVIWRRATERTEASSSTANS